MADMEQRNMNVYTNQITKLKNEFASVFKQDEDAAVNILKKMRIIHGLAIYDDVVEKSEIEKKGPSELSEDILIRLSTNASMLHIMHSHVRQCERLAYNHKRGIAMDSLLSSDDHSLKKLETSSKDKKFGHSSLHTENHDMRNIFEPNTLPRSDTKIQKGSSCHAKLPPVESDSFNTTEYINNLNTSDAAKLVSEYEKQSNVKPNSSDKLVYYLASWCPYSQKFNKTWDEFMKNARSKFPNLQIEKIDVGNDKDKVNEALQMGVSGYPTIVIIHNGKTYSKTPTNMSVEEIVQYLKDIINSK